MTGFGLVSATKPDVFRWHKMSRVSFPESEPPSPCLYHHLEGAGRASFEQRPRGECYLLELWLQRYQRVSLAPDRRKRIRCPFSPEWLPLCCTRHWGTLTRHLGVEICLPRCCQTGAQSCEADQGNVFWLGGKPDERVIFGKLFWILVDPATDIIHLWSITSWPRQDLKCQDCFYCYFGWNLRQSVT